MAQKKISLGSFKNVILYDDANTFQDGSTHNTLGTDGDVAMNQITLGVDPTANMQAATKQYVDNKSGAIEMTGNSVYNWVDTAGDITTNGVRLIGIGENNGWPSFQTLISLYGTWDGVNKKYTSYTTSESWINHPKTSYIKTGTHTPLGISGYVMNNLNATAQVYFYLGYHNSTELQVVMASAVEFYAITGILAAGASGAVVSMGTPTSSIPAGVQVVLMIGIASTATAGGVSFKLNIT